MEEEKHAAEMEIQKQRVELGVRAQQRRANGGPINVDR